MVFVKVRETYDLHTVQNKMTIIGIHTPKPDIIKANYPGLLMQCKAYRPVSADVKIACASVLPLDPQGIGLAEGDVAPEDVFNPILYKAISNIGMSQIEARITANSLDATGIAPVGGVDVVGQTADVDVDTMSEFDDEFPLYYGLLSNAHGWKTANPQSGLEMRGLVPLVYEMLYNVGDNVSAVSGSGFGDTAFGAPKPNGTKQAVPVAGIRGNGKPMFFINCTSYSGTSGGNVEVPGFRINKDGTVLANAEVEVPWLNVVCGCIIIPPSRLHELFYRMVVEWTIEFSKIRPLSEVVSWAGLGVMAGITHYQNYDYETAKKALGVDAEVMNEDTCMVSTNVPIEKVM